MLMFIFLLALYLPFVQGLFTMTNNGNFTTCTRSSIQQLRYYIHMSTAVFVISMWRVNSYGGKYDNRTACAWL